MMEKRSAVAWSQGRKLPTKEHKGLWVMEMFFIMIVVVVIRGVVLVTFIKTHYAVLSKWMYVIICKFLSLKFILKQELKTAITNGIKRTNEFFSEILAF